MPTPKHIIVIAGETSGDMHAAHLVREIQHLDPSITFSGLGGSKMQEADVELYHDMTKIAVVGFVEVLKHYGTFRRIFYQTLKEIRQRRPAAVVLVDYPGFNLRLAKKIKKRGIKVIYYISPQIWAWKKNRVYAIKKYVDKMLVLFEFEKEFYARFGMEVDFVGNPLIDDITVNVPKEQFLQKHRLLDYKMTIGILPGSRQKEVDTLLPIMLKAAAILTREFPMIQFLIVKAPTIEQACIEGHIQNHETNPPQPLSLAIVEDMYDGINACQLCMVASGTATLETAILQKPMVITYKTSFLTWALAKCFIKIPDIGLVNVVAQQRIVPECVQYQATGEHIAKKLKNMFTNEIRLTDIKSELLKVKRSLGDPGASRRAAEVIFNNT